MSDVLFRAGTSDESITVPSGRSVKHLTATAGGSGGTIIITPKNAIALNTITVLAGGTFSEDFTTYPSDLDTSELPGGTTIAFAGMGAWYVRFT